MKHNLQPIHSSFPDFGRIVYATKLLQTIFTNKTPTAWIISSPEMQQAASDLSGRAVRTSVLGRS